MRADNWGWRARIGLFIVGNEAVPEAEWWAMAPPGVSVHAARVTAPTPWAAWHADRSAVTLAGSMAGEALPSARAMLAPAIRKGWVPARLEMRTRSCSPDMEGRTI